MYNTRFPLVCALVFATAAASCYELTSTTTVHTTPRNWTGTGTLGRGGPTHSLGLAGQDPTFRTLRSSYSRIFDPLTDRIPRSARPANLTPYAECRSADP
ncbi:MAG: hypothetical protein V3V08_18565, partial [Nannocystaceae bacterium]